MGRQRKNGPESAGSASPVQPIGEETLENPTEDPQSSRQNRTAKVAGATLFWLTLVVAAVAFGAASWVRREFGIVSIEQTLINLEGAGVEGGGGSEIVVRGVLHGLVVPILAVAAIFTLWMLVIHRWLDRTRARRSLIVVGGATLAFTALLGSAAYLANTFSVADYFKGAFSGRDLADYCVAPAAALTQSAAAQPLNLVLVYLESVEDAMGKEGPFETNMLQPADKATEGWATVEGLQEYFGGGFTMSGIVSTQCGVPLRTGDFGPRYGDEMNAFGSEAEQYLPGAVPGGPAGRRGIQRSVSGGRQWELLRQAKVLPVTRLPRGLWT